MPGIVICKESVGFFHLASAFAGVLNKVKKTKAPVCRIIKVKKITVKIFGNFLGMFLLSFSLSVGKIDFFRRIL